MSELRLRGLCAGNLRDIDLDLPHGRWTALHGPSGAGKSALLFGVLEPVAQRRFRVLRDPAALPGGQEAWLERLARRVEGLQPVVAWAGEIPRGRAAVEIATALDLWGVLAAAWQERGERSCPACRQRWRPWDRSTLAARAASWPEGAAVHVYGAAGGVSPHELLLGGWTRCRIGDELLRLEAAPEPLPAGAWLLLDRFRWSAERLPRLLEAAGEALRRRVALKCDLAEGAQEEVLPAPDRCPSCGADLPRRDAAELAGVRDASDLVIHGRAWREWVEAPLEEWLGLDARGAAPGRRRLAFLARTGLGHLAATRTLGTLSLGEARRLELVALLSQVRRDQLILFDEPGMGLHGSERLALAALLRELVEQGNTVLTADPAREFLESADGWVLLGPGGGAAGGRVVAQGGRSELPPHQELAAQPRPWMPGASLRFLDLRARFLDIGVLELPLGCVLAVVGVSGSGKTTLFEEELVPRLREQRAYRGELPRGGVAVLLERALGSAAMSTVATLSGAWTEIRAAFADGEEGRIRGLSAADFVARPGQGACHLCRGHGVDPDRLPCPSCGGLGLREDLLELRLRDRSLRYWLSTPLRALEKRLPSAGRLRALVKLLDKLGMGDRRFGERGRHLSLGERSRIALARELSRARSGLPKLFLLDEPCLGLPGWEARRVVEVLRELSAAGHGFWVVEHNEILLRGADQIVELGPGAGPRGGRLLFQGPAELLLEADTPTGVWLRRRLQEEPPPPAPRPRAAPRTQALPDDWRRLGRSRLEEELLREFATRSPLLADVTGGGDASEALPPVAWPAGPPGDASLMAVLGLEGPLQEALQRHGRPACAQCGGGGPWPDLYQACTAQEEAGLPPGEWSFTTPLALPEGARGSAVELLRAAGFRRVWREGAVVGLTPEQGVKPADEVWLDRLDPRAPDGAGRMRDLEHQARLLGAGRLVARDAAGASWRYRSGACRRCGAGEPERPAAVVLQLAGRDAWALLAAPLEETLRHCVEQLPDAGPFADVPELLAGSSLLRRPGASRPAALTPLENRLARLGGWLLFPLEGVVLLHDQPLSGLPPPLARRLARRLARSGLHHYTDPEGYAAAVAPAPRLASAVPIQPFSLEFDFAGWAEPRPAAAAATLREALELVVPLRDQFLASEEARLRGWSAADLGRGAAARRCPQCRGAGGSELHPELRVPCSSCRGSGWARETAILEVRGLRWPDLGFLKLAELRGHFADTPALRDPLAAAEAFGMGGLPLDTPLARLPLGARVLAPLAARIAAGDPERLSGLRLAHPLAGLAPLEAVHLIPTMSGYLHDFRTLEWRDHHPVCTRVR